MNRVIKFRGKRKDNGKWWYGSLISWPDGDAEIANLCKDDEGNKFLVHPETVGQFIGAVDRNGKEIFEGDIIFSRNVNGRHCASIILYDNYLCRFKGIPTIDGNNWIAGGISRHMENADMFEVINNIHDNPDYQQNPLQRSSVTNTMKDPNVKTEEEVKEPAEQAPAPAPEAQPGSAEGETGE